MDQVGIAISPGSMVQIAVSPTLINITQDAIERFEPKERNCYTPKEIELPHFKFIDDYRYEVLTYAWIISKGLSRLAQAPMQKLKLPGSIRSHLYQK